MGLVMHSAFVITDSGGLQKEAYFCRKKALVVMPDTGWRELVEVGWNVLVDGRGSSWDLVLRLSDTENCFDKTLEAVYGEGNAAKKIAEIINSLFRDPT